MKEKLRFLVKNKQSFIALFVLLAMAFNACSDPAGSDTSDFTPMGFYVDSSGNSTETDSGRTILVADKKADVVFYSDNIVSSTQRVGFAFEDKTIIFFFQKNQNFPTSIVLSDSEESYNGVFTPYDPVTQTYGLTVKQGGDTEIWSNIALSKDIFTQYKDDPEFTSSQNLRMRNLYISMSIYTSLDDFIGSDDTLQARSLFGFLNVVVSFFPSPVVKIVVGAVQIIGGIGEIYVGFNIGDGFLIRNGIVDTVYGVINLINGIKETSSGGSSSGGGGGGGGGSVPATPAAVPVTGVSLNKTSVSLVVGAAETLVPNITPANATNKVVSWSSSNTAVAAVSSNGTVTAVAPGSATITVTTTDGGKTDSCNVAVTPILVTGITLNKASTNMVVNGTETLFAEVEPTNAANKTVNWSSNNTAVATVSLDGMVTAIAPGTATITVTTVDGGKTAACDVAVSTSSIAVTSISLNKSSTDFYIGATETLVAYITPSNATNQNVTWNSSNTSVATVSTSGVVTGVTSGSAIITVTTADGGKTATCSVNVTNPTFTSWEAFASWLAARPNNTKSNPYSVKVNISDLPEATSIKATLSNKYVNLDLSGSTFTSLGANFARCTGLTSITIPSSVTSHALGSITGCTDLTAINVDTGNSTYTSENGVLYTKDKTTLICYPAGKTGSFTIPNGVIYIHELAFQYCTSLTSVTIPNSVTWIRDFAFQYCTALTSVTIGNSVTNIRTGFSSYCTGLTAINVDAGNSTYTSENGVLYNKNKTTLICYPAGKTGSFTIPNSVTSIGNSAFSCCTGFTSITIPNSVSSIGDLAFSSSYLNSVTFQGTIASSKFHSYAFDGDLRDKFYATNPTNGTPGTYKTSGSGLIWTKQ